VESLETNDFMSVMNTKVMVTGKRGFIAKHLIKLLNKSEPKIDVWSADKNYDLIPYIDYIQPNFIFHLGAELKDDEKMFDSNVLLTVKIMDWCKSHKGTKLILFGSSSEYGHLDKSRSEDDPLCPSTIYEGTKAATAMLAESWAKTYGLDIIFVRPFTIYGEDEKPTKLSSILFRKWKDGSVLELSDGVHDYMYVEDFVNILVEIVFGHENKGFNKINIGSGVQVSNFEFVRMFEKVTGYKFTIKLRDSADPSVWVCDTSKLKLLYDIFPPEHLESGIRRMVFNYNRDGGDNC
jgi:nucleoside-diphosphate-sugar epimerase